MKIIHITPVFRPYRAGIGNVVYHQARELVSRGHEVVVLTLRYDKGWLDVDMCDGIEVRRLDPLIRYGKGGFAPALYQELILECQGMPSPVIHLHTPFFGGQELVWLAKKLHRMYGTRLIIQYHHDPQLNLLTKLLSIPSKLIFKSLIRSADQVIVSSLDYARESDLYPLLTKEGVGGGLDPSVSPLSKGRVVEIPLGVDLSLFKAKYNVGKAKPHEPFKLIFLGALDHAHHFKGLAILLQALARHEINDVHLTVMGGGELRKYYEQLARKLKLAEQAVFLGYVPDKELSRHFRNADMLVFPSTGKAEAFGLVVLEAMASGLPVLASDLPGVRTLFSNSLLTKGGTKGGLLVEPGNIDQLAEKIKYAAKHRAMLSKIGKTNRKIVEEKYTWERVVDQLEVAYKGFGG